LETEEKAQAWRKAILEVLAGRMNVTEASALLGVSRKTYYEKQERAFAGMLEALEDRPTGRPGNPVDPEKEELREELGASRKAMEQLAHKLRVQNVLRQALTEAGAHLSADKKKRAT